MTPLDPRLESWENRASTALPHAMGRVLRGLPRLWVDRRRAARAKASLPEPSGGLELPDEGTLFGWIERLCEAPHRRPGTAHGHRAEAWLASTLEALGLDVHIDPIPITVRDPDSVWLEVEGERLSCFFIPSSAPTRAPITAPLVYVGRGSARDYDAVDVRGKIVVADIAMPTLPTGVLLKILRAAYAISDPDGELGLSSRHLLSFARQNFVGGAVAERARDDAYWRAHRRGAAAIVLTLPTVECSHYGPYDGMVKPLAGLWVGRETARRIRAACRRGGSASLFLGGAAAPSTMSNIWAVLPGRSDETLLVTSHHDSPHVGAVEDGSGVAQVLAQAYAWSRVPEASRAKSLCFVLTGGHFYGSLGAHEFARTHTDLMGRARALITLEHLAARARANDSAPAMSAIFSSKDPTLIACVMRALQREPARACAAIPDDLLAPVPTSDAMGFVLQSDVPVVSWIGCPEYLLDAGDTLDMIIKSDLVPVARTVAELVSSLMALPSARWAKAARQTRSPHEGTAT